MSDTSTDDEIFDVDVLVIGGGMAGLTAAASAADRGARTLIVEKAPQVGGSAALALGFFWSVASLDVLRQENPLGDPALGEVLVDGYDSAVRWLTDQGIDVSDRVDLDDVMGFASHAHMFDLLGYFTRCQRKVEAAGGHVVTNATAEELLVQDGRVVGAVVGDRDGTTRVRAGATLLSTGGFQCDPDLRERYLGAGGQHLLPRSNPHSSGAGLRLGMSLGADTSEHMRGFYGHLVPSPLPHGFQTSDYVPLSLVFSPKCIIVDRDGRRTFDESRGYFVNAQTVAAMPGQRALLIGDQRVRDDDLEAFRAAGGEQVDRVAEAIGAEAHAVVTASLDELERVARSWGYENIHASVVHFNDEMARLDEAGVVRSRHRRPLDRPPYFAIEVQPAVTFTHGGLRIAPDCRVLRADGSTIPGLLAAGADAGGLYAGGYAGGLAMAAVFGLRAAATMSSG